MSIAFHSRTWLVAAALAVATVASPALAVSPALPPPGDVPPSLAGQALLRACAEPSANLLLSLALIGAVWLAGAAVIKATDFLEMRSAAARARSRGRRG